MTKEQDSRHFIAADLLRKALELEQGRHLCLVYDSNPQEQLPAIVPFITAGLGQGERCVYVADDQSIDDLELGLKDYGIDVDTARENERLLLWTREKWRQPGELDSATKSMQVATLIEEALQSGFKGIRFVIEMTWTLGPDISADKLRHWEATINSIFTPEVPARIICQYSRRAIGASSIHAGLVTHPIAVLGLDVCPNPFYEAPMILSGNGKSYGESSFNVDWMISQLQWAARAFEGEREKRIRAEADVRAHDEFLGIISHELRTPLTAIYGGIRLLRKLGNSIDVEDRTEIEASIEVESNRLYHMMEDLLALARAQAPQELQCEPLLAQRIIEKVALDFIKGGATVQYNLQSSLPTAIGHPTYVERILWNLLTNAQKYSPSGAPIEIVAERNGDDVHVSVLDRGSGVSAEELHLIFDGFYRSEKTLGLASGSGLGLGVCKRLAEAQGGAIWASSRENGGLQVTFSLPAYLD